MKPAPFEYVAAGTVDEAVAALAASEDARLLAGGQSLVPLLNLRLARPDVVVDLNGVAELDFAAADNGTVHIGALTRHRRIELDPDLRRRAPLLAEAAALVGHPQIRNRATIGGSIAHADPVAELGAALLALEGSIVARSTSGRRTIPARELFDGYFTTTLAPGELLTEIEVPSTRPGAGHAFREYAPRHGDFALAGIAALVGRADGACTEVRLAGCGVGSTPLDLSACAEPLLGATTLSPDALRDVAERVAVAIAPVGDVHGSAEYRTDLARLLTVDALRTAWTRSAEDGG